MVSCVWEFDLGDGCFELVLAHIRSRGTASQQGLGSAWWTPERLLSHGLFESARWVLAERLSSGAWTPTVMGCVPSVFFPQRERQAQRIYYNCIYIKISYKIKQEGNIPKYTSDYAGCGRLIDISPLFSISSKFLKSNSIIL